MGTISFTGGIKQDFSGISRAELVSANPPGGRAGTADLPVAVEA